MIENEGFPTETSTSPVLFAIRPVVLPDQNGSVLCERPFFDAFSKGAKTAGRAGKFRSLIDCYCLATPLIQPSNTLDSIDDRKEPSPLAGFLRIRCP